MRRVIKGIWKYTILTFLLLTSLSCGGGGGGGGGTTSTTTSNPKVLSISPSADATEVDITKITVTFDSAMDSSTLTTTTFTVSYSSGSISGTVSYDSTTNTATFTPTYFFTPLTTFSATLTTGVKDVKGNPMSSQYSWSFTTATGFIAQDFTTEKYYAIEATKVAEGTYCYIYLEKGQSVSQATIDAIKNEFDTKIYPYVTSSFGSEPNPGIDGKSKLYILLLDIKDGYDPISNSGYTAGYFSQVNEYSQSGNPYTYTNLKEMLYMDVNPATPGSSKFYNTLAHEFQHMIHWEQKTRKMSLSDDKWLNEAMSEIAPTYCGYGPSYNRVKTFEEAPSNSLTKWDDAVEDYGVVYMWAQYYKDRIGSNIFYKILLNNKTGIDSVNAALTEIGHSKDFTGTFRDWAIANFSGNQWSGYPEWSYISINTWPGTYNGITLSGLFSSSSKKNVSTLQPLDKWSVDYYYYYTFWSIIGLGSVKWSPASSSDKATFVDWGNGILYDGLTAGISYSYYTYGYLIAHNPSENSGGGDSIIYSKPTLKTPKDILDEANKNPIIKKLREETGEPQPVCIHSYFTEEEKELRAKGARPPF